MDKILTTTTLVAAAAAIALATITLIAQSAIASNAYNAGYNDGRYAAQTRSGYHPQCGFEHSETDCADYRLGYTAGWAASCVVHYC